MGIKSALAIGATLVAISCCGGTKPTTDAPVVLIAEEDPRCEISIMFGGDVMFHGPQITAARNAEGEYDVTRTFKYIKPLWNDCDAVVFNLETTLAESNYSGYPQFAAPKDVAHNLKECGVTHVVLANNHVCDKFSNGVITTAKHLKEAKLESAGSYVDSVAWRKNSPLWIEKEGFKIALLNYTYGTNGIPVPKGIVVPHIDTTAMRQDIERAKAASATNIVTFMHWGYEYHTSPSAEQKMLAQWLHANGVDIVIGSHPHVIQPSRADSTGVTVYSMGNLVSNQRKRYTNGGMLVRLDIVRDTTLNECHYSIEHLPHFVYKAPLGDSPRYYCTPENLIDSVIVNDPAQRKEARQFFDDTRLILSK